MCVTLTVIGQAQEAVIAEVAEADGLKVCCSGSFDWSGIVLRCLSQVVDMYCLLVENEVWSRTFSGSVNNDRDILNRTRGDRLPLAGRHSEGNILAHNGWARLVRSAADKFYLDKQE